MPSFDGGDQLSPEYAPSFHIGLGNNFVWQTAETAEHDGWLYRAGKTDDDELVCERRPLEDTPGGTLLQRQQLEDVPILEIPKGLFPNLRTFGEITKEIKGLLNEVEPGGTASAQLDAQIARKRS